MLCSSSKRALSSTSAVTDLPASAASISAATIGLSLAGAVERLLDRHHVRVARRLLHELHHHLEALVGVVDDEVLLPDRGEAVAAEVLDPLGKARREGREQQVRPVLGDHLARHRRGRGSRRRRRGPRRGTFELVTQEAAHALRACRRSTDEPDHVAAPAALDHGLEQPDQVLGLLLDLDVAVAQDAEEAAALALEAGEQQSEKRQDQLLQADEAQAARPGRRMKRSNLPGSRTRPVERLAAAAVELERHADAGVGDERERVRGIDGDRRQDRR